MYSLLKTMNKEPVKFSSILLNLNETESQLSESCRQRLRSMHINSFDHKKGGLNSPVKYIDRDSVEYSLTLANDNDQSEANMAKLTLDNAMALIDKEWGGVFQYSTQYRWDLPHHKKTMANQAAMLILYSLAYAQFKQTRYLAVTQMILAYIAGFLTSENGAFYCSQSDHVAGMDPRWYFSLNDSARRQFGIPDIDETISSRENGWAIEALAACFEYTGDESSLTMATSAMQIMIRNCQLRNGGWRTSLISENNDQLAVNLAMARAALQLYRVTFRKSFMDIAERTLDYINLHFRDNVAGYISHSLMSGKSSPRQIDENISLGRFANLMFQYTHKQRYRDIALHTFRFLSIFEIATCRMEDAGILLLEKEMNTTPVTFTLETNFDRRQQTPFLENIYRYPGWYKLIQWQHSEHERVTVTLDGLHSRPIYTTERLQDLLHLPK